MSPRVNGSIADRAERAFVTTWYSRYVPGGDVTLTYDEAMAICLLLAEAADAVTDDDQLRDTWAEEARLMIELVLNRTDD